MYARKHSHTIPHLYNAANAKTGYILERSITAATSNQSINTLLPTHVKHVPIPTPIPPPLSQPPPPNPSAANPTPSQNVKRNVNVLQFNCNGLKGKLTEILLWMKEKEVKIAALQETKLNECSKLSDTSNYTLVRRDRKKDEGGGLAFLVHKDILFQTLPPPPDDPHIEYLAIKVDNLTIVNLYIPPASSCDTPGYNPSIAPFLTSTETLIVGDFNAHDELWYSTLADNRGSQFSNEIGSSDFGTLNEDSPTRSPTNGQPSSPYISLATMSLIPYINWKTYANLGSDHLPIILTLEKEINMIESEDIIFNNFKKADWSIFTDKPKKNSQK